VKRREEYRDLTGDPWDGMTLEWATASPPPPYNFALLPQVHERDELLAMKERGAAPRGIGPFEDIAMPGPSAAGIVIGALAFGFGFGMVWHIWWLALLCGALMAAAIIWLGSDDDGGDVLSAVEVARIEARHRNGEPVR
jgi:cytochrome o ubiquinol oxidase subunit 1